MSAGAWSRAGLGIVLLAACTRAEPMDVKAPMSPERELSVEVELLELPALEAANAEQDPNKPVESPPPIQGPRAESEGKDGEGGKTDFFRALRRGLLEDKSRANDIEAGDGGTLVPPPPPPPPPPDPSGPERLKTVKQATGESVGGRVEPTSIQDAVAEKRALFTRCLSTDSKLVMEATISASGDVIDARSTSSQPDDPKLRDCVVDVFKRLKLKPLATPQPARVKFALALKRNADY